MNKQIRATEFESKSLCCIQFEIARFLGRQRAFCSLIEMSYQNIFSETT